MLVVFVFPETGHTSESPLRPVFDGAPRGLKPSWKDEELNWQKGLEPRPD